MLRLGMLDLELACLLPALCPGWSTQTQAQHSLFHSTEFLRAGLTGGLNKALAVLYFLPASGGCGHLGLIDNTLSLPSCLQGVLPV